MDFRASLCFVIMGVMFMNSITALSTTDDALSSYYFDGNLDDYFDEGKLF